MIPVIYKTFDIHSPDRGYWDMTLISDIVSSREFHILNQFEIDTYIKTLQDIVIIFPASKNVDKVKELNDYIKQFNSVVLILTTDEDSLFPIDEISHPNIQILMQTPKAGRLYKNVDRFIPEGYTPQARLNTDLPVKNNKWFFSGQITHKRRREMITWLETLKDGKLIKTSGFTHGLSPDEYINEITDAKIIPCPSGACTPDSFRFYESLERGCIPILDAISSVNNIEGYWNLILGQDHPIPVIKDWEEIGGLITYYFDVFPQKSNEVFAWWQMKKRQIKKDLINDFMDMVTDKKHYISLGEEIHGKTTVIIPTSPILSHPDTSIIEETIKTVREHLSPEMADIIITFDGVREEQKERFDDYQEYIRRMLWKCNYEYENVYPVIFNNYTHQVGMLRKALDYVNTSTILYVEHDAPITPDCEIPFAQFNRTIENKKADVIRLHFEAFIPEPHKYMMLDQTPIMIDETPYVRTFQWSQRPHIASTEFYKRILKDHFSPDAKTFIEDKMHSVCAEAYKIEQLQGWNKYKIMIYHPDGNIKRSYNLDGRGSEQKYSMQF